MNSNSNETALEADILMNLIGNLPALQYTYVYLLIPLSLIAIVANILIFIVLGNKEFQSKAFFFFFKLNVFNSIILSLVISTSFVGQTKKVFELNN